MNKHQQKPYRGLAGSGTLKTDIFDRRRTKQSSMCQSQMSARSVNCLL